MYRSIRCLFVFARRQYRQNIEKNDARSFYRPSRGFVAQARPTDWFMGRTPGHTAVRVFPPIRRVLKKPGEKNLWPRRPAMGKGGHGRS